LKSLDQILGYVDIDAVTKAIMLGRSITVDGFARRPIRVLTHAHSDHLVGLKDSIIYSNHIIATPATLELVVELEYVPSRYKAIYKRKAIGLDYYQTVEFNREKIMLLPSDHILGSAQVLVEVDEYRLGYTGDFKLGGKTAVMKDLDVLVIEATYGHPDIRRVFKEDVIDLVIDLVIEGLRKYGKVAVYGYYGKLQEVMAILREYGISEPFVMNHRMYSVTKIAEKYGLNIGCYFRLGTQEAREVVDSGRYIVFEHMVKAKRRRLDGTILNLVLSGHEYNEPIRRVDQYTWLASFSDHADFDELMEYVERANPKFIVVDASREGYPHVFARELQRRGWKVAVLPREREIRGKHR